MSFRIVILASGRGSNAINIIDAVKKGLIEDSIVVAVISDNPDASVLQKAKEKNIDSYYLYPGKFKTKLEGEEEENYINFIKNLNPDLICLAGFMRILKKKFIETFKDRIINIHPSLLPKYPGLNTHQRVIENKEKKSGCTVHFVNEEIDGGRIIIQREVDVLENDTPETLAKRVLAEEHKAYIEAINIVKNSLKNKL